jgi:hypothetical protein
VSRSEKTSYPVTPTLSVDAFHVSETFRPFWTEAVRPIGTDGTVVSPLPGVVAVADAGAPTFPAAS